MIFCKGFCNFRGNVFLERGIFVKDLFDLLFFFFYRKFQNIGIKILKSGTRKWRNYSCIAVTVHFFGIERVSAILSVFIFLYQLFFADTFKSYFTKIDKPNNNVFANINIKNECTEI